jgi:acetyl-CoA carboxylase carboxyltransferase component
MAGAITAAAADKAPVSCSCATAFGLPVVSLIDCPGYMVGPAAEAEGLVRRASRMLVAGAAMRVPLVAVRAAPRLRPWRTSDDGRQPARAVADGGVAGAHLGPMGLEGAVRLGCARSWRRSPTSTEREQRVRQATEAAQQNAKALNAAQLFEIDDVIDPADTRRIIADTLAAATTRVELPAARPVRRYLVKSGDGAAIAPHGKWSLIATVLEWYPGHARHRRFV